ncbi:MAG TPA: RNA polymerase sigma factor [Chitinophagaceae bacterium]
MQEHIEEIIRDCKKGNRRAQEKLYKNYYQAMMSLCLYYTKNETDAVEVLNTGFLKVFHNIKRYESTQASLYTWIRTIVINSCLDHIKAKKTGGHEELDEAADVHIESAVVSKMNAKELLDMVRQLPPATQAVFNLYMIEGYSHKEIAALLGISIGTSKWHLSEARKQLQNMLEPKVIRANG